MGRFKALVERRLDTCRKNIPDRGGIILYIFTAERISSAAILLTERSLLHTRPAFAYTSYRSIGVSKDQPIHALAVGRAWRGGREW